MKSFTVAEIIRFSYLRLFNRKFLNYFIKWFFNMYRPAKTWVDPETGEEKR